MASKKTVSFQATDKGKTKQAHNAVESLSEAARPNQIAMGGGRGGGDRAVPGQVDSLANTDLRSRDATDEQFPTNELTQSSEQDVLMTEKLSLSDGNGTSKFGMLIAKDSDFAWLRGMREKEAEANFQQWFAANFDRMSPELKKMARELWPEFYNQRVEQLNHSIDLQRRLAMLKVKGIQNKDDLLLQYAAEAGYIDADPLENILHPEKARDAQNRATRQARYSRGILNPRRLLRGDWGDAKRSVNAQQLMGRGAGAFGDVPAYTLGTGNAGFSAVGPLTDLTEKNANYPTQMGYLEQFTN